MKEIKLAIATPLTHKFVPIEFFESYLAMEKPVKHMFLLVGSYQGLDAMRNKLVDGAQKYGCTHILFLDVDHRHHPQTVSKLLAHNLPIVSGLSYMRNDPYEPCLFRGMINKYRTVTEWNENDLIEVDSVGAACLLVDMDVFKYISKPYFQFMKNPDQSSNFDLGEDVVFCNKAKQAGYKIFVDTSCGNSHLGTVEVNKKFSDKWHS